MRKALEFRQHAAECRAMARTIHKEDYRQQLLKMAEIWESLAVERERIQKLREDKAEQ
jgi:hypothetical protein